VTDSAPGAVTESTPAGVTASTSGAVTDSPRVATRHIVGPVSDLPAGSRRIVTIGRRSIGVYNVDGHYFAIRNRCPHQGGPLCLGTTSGLATAVFPDDDAPAVLMEREGEIVKCPWHGWQFDMRTGEAIFGEGVRVATYKAYRADELSGPSDDVVVPDNVETYRTVVEDGYVIVEIPLGGPARKAN
jgi:nitrite reductase/ring-hydroxylating ferredoxin subunit